MTVMDVYGLGLTAFMAIGSVVYLLKKLGRLVRGKR